MADNLSFVNSLLSNFQNNWLGYHAKEFLLACTCCQGRGQLKWFQHTPLQFSAKVEDVAQGIDRIIIRCDECNGKGKVLDDEAWNTFKSNHSAYEVMKLNELLEIILNEE